MSWVWGLLIVAGVYFATNFVVRRLGLFSSALDSESLRDLLLRKNGPVCLVDVRTSEEYAGGHIPTAICIPHHAIAQNPPSVSKEAIVVIYCQTGTRSVVAKAHLRRLGFANVINFGPLRRWRGALVSGVAPGSIAAIGSARDGHSQ